MLGSRDLGPTISSFNVFLILTGIETLSLRVQCHFDNALAVARWLKAHPKIGWVHYAGLEDSDNHAIQQHYCQKGWAPSSPYWINDSYAAVKVLVRRLQLFSCIADIGDTRSLIIHTASTTHTQLMPEQQPAAGTRSDVVRLSIGVEDVKDIVTDLE